MMTMKRILFSVFVSLLSVWGVSFFLGSHPNVRVNDPETGLQLPAAGSVVARFSEGGGVSHYGRLGLNPKVYNEENAGKPFFLLYGDSYIEALQVSDDEKPDAVLTKALSGEAVAYGVGRSGFGFSSMIVRATEYEHVLGQPIAHVFFCASGIRNDIFEDGGIEVEKCSGGFRKRVVQISQYKQWYLYMVNRLHLNFVVDFNKLVAELRAKRKASPKSGSPQLESQGDKDISKELSYIFNSMKTQLNAPVIVVYCPNVPRIGKGLVIRDNPELEDVKVLKQSAEEHGIAFVDLTETLLDLFDRKSIVAHGFSNLGGPGNGHLNVDGIEAVFQYVADYLKGTYAL